MSDEKNTPIGNNEMEEIYSGMIEMLKRELKREHVLIHKHYADAEKECESKHKNNIYAFPVEKHCGEQNELYYLNDDMDIVTAAWLQDLKDHIDEPATKIHRDIHTIHYLCTYAPYSSKDDENIEYLLKVLKTLQLEIEFAHRCINDWRNVDEE